MLSREHESYQSQCSRTDDGSWLAWLAICGVFGVAGFVAGYAVAIVGAW